MTDYFVSSGGVDSSTGGTIGNPWRTIKYALNHVSGGDVINVRAGTYVENVDITGVNGNGSWITVQPYNNEAVIVDGSPTGNYNGAFLLRDGCHYIRLTGLEIRNSNYANTLQTFGAFLYGTTYADVTNIRVDHCNIHHHAASGIYAYHASNIEFDNNLVDYVHASNISQEAISFSGVLGFNIHHNVLTRYGKEGIDMKSGTSNGACHHNLVDNSNPPAEYSAGLHTCIYIDAMYSKNSNIEVYKNYLKGDSGPGLCMGPEHPEGSHEDIWIYNNVIHLKSKTGTQYRAIDTTTQTGNAHTWKNVYLINNTIYSEADQHVLRIIPNVTNITNLVLANNIITGTTYYQMYFQLMTPAQAFQPGKVILANNLYHRHGGTAHNRWVSQENPAGGWGTNPVISDPFFVDRINSNHHLRNTSPAINEGNIVYAPDDDYDGVLRGSQIDIGAYEYTLPPNIDDAVAFTINII